MTQLLVVRHGETDWNADARVQGHSDIPMNDNGRKQVQRTARMLKETRFSAVYSSDLTRAYETAAIITEGRNLEIRRMPELRERCWGVWEGRTMSQLAAEDPDGYRRLREGEWVDPDGSEDYETIQDRITGAFLSIAADHPDETILIATHGGPVKVLTAWVLGAPVAAHHRMRIGNASVTTFILRGERFVLESYNVTPPQGEPEPPNPGKALIESAF